MPTNIWNIDASGDWSVASDWSTGAIPVSSQDVTISTANVRTITHGSGTDTVNSLTVGADHFDLTGGSLEILTTASFAMDFTQTGGSLLGAASITVNGSGTLTGGYAGGTTALRVNGSVAFGGYTLGAGATMVIAGVANQTGQVTIGDNSGVNAKLRNSATGTYTIANDSGLGSGASSASFVNVGLLQKTAGSGTSTISTATTDSGTIAVASGTLDFNGPVNSFAGTITGAGQFEIGGGVNTIAAGTTLTVGSVMIAGAVVTLAGDLSYAGSFSEGGLYGAVTSLSLGGYTLTLSGPLALVTNFGTLAINGSGTLVTSGTTSLQGLVLGGSAVWQNKGTVNATGTLQIGDASGSLNRIANVTGGVYNLVSDVGIAVGANLGSNFNNNGGTLAKTGGTGTSTVAASFQDGSGAAAQVQIASGTLDFTGSSNKFVAQAISGAGQFEIGAGANTIGAGTTVTTGSMTVSNAALVMAESLSYAGAFTVFEYATATTIDLGGYTLTLTGPVALTAALGTPAIGGSGTLVTSGTTVMTGLVLGGSAVWQNSGTVNASGTLQIGDASTLKNRFANVTGGTYNLTTDVGIAVGANAASNFNNNGGTLAKTGGTGTSTVAASFQDGSAAAAQIQIATGTLDFAGATNSFVAQAISGAGVLELGGGIDTIGPGTTITTGSMLLSGVSVTLTEDLSYAGALSASTPPGAPTVVTLSGGNTLTLGGPVTLTAQYGGTPLVNGTGTLLTTNVTNLTGLVVGGTASWRNTGTVNDTGTLQIGDGSGATSQFTNAAGATFNLENVGIAGGASLAEAFNNNGTVVKTGSGSGYIGVSYTNSASATSSINLSGGGLEFGRSVQGNSTIAMTAGTTLQFDDTVGAGTTVAFSAGANDRLTIGQGALFSGAVSGFATNDIIDLPTIQNNQPVLTYSGNATRGTLTIADHASHTASIVFNGNYTAASFKTQADYNGTDLLFA